jgi:hypothetical protein
MKAYNNSTVGAALMLGMKPDMLVNCLEHATTISQLKLEVQFLKETLEAVRKDNDTLTEMLTRRLTQGDN